MSYRILYYLAYYASMLAAILPCYQSIQISGQSSSARQLCPGPTCLAGQPFNGGHQQPTTTKSPIVTVGSGGNSADSVSSRVGNDDDDEHFETTFSRTSNAERHESYQMEESFDGRRRELPTQFKGFHFGSMRRKGLLEVGDDDVVGDSDIAKVIQDGKISSK